MKETMFLFLATDRVWFRMAKPMATKRLGQPGVSILGICGMRSLKSSMEAEIVTRLTSVVVFAIVLNGSLCSIVRLCFLCPESGRS